MVFTTRQKHKAITGVSDKGLRLGRRPIHSNLQHIPPENHAKPHPAAVHGGPARLRPESRENPERRTGIILHVLTGNRRRRI